MLEMKPSPGVLGLRPTLADFALAALAVSAAPLEGAAELEYLAGRLHAVGGELGLRRAMRAHLDSEHSAMEDAALRRVGEALRLQSSELLAVALAASVERDPMAGRALAYLQRPVGSSRPTLWLVDRAFAPFSQTGRSMLDDVLAGAAVASGLLEVHGTGLPIVERNLALPTHVLFALWGLPATRPGYAFDACSDELPLPESVLEVAQAHARGLLRGQERSLIVRCGSRREGRAVAAALAAAMSRRAVFIATDDVTALSPWLYASALLPVFERPLDPSEHYTVPRIAHYSGPCVILCGLDGGVNFQHSAPLTWTVTVPRSSERQVLWQLALHDNELAKRLALAHRHGASRIAELGQLARRRAEIEARDVSVEDVVEVSRTNDPAGLAVLAEPMTHRVQTEALIVPPQIRRELDLMLLRCRTREALVTELGIAATTRYRPGVRALFSGESGTGKTLAAGWIATQLGLPIYRVDVASVVSKYIGETEKNLATLLTRAEHAEVVLLFDEADSLFGKRTEVKQANDRFANTQTNYLLQRIESYDGIVILTTNSRARLDAAFTRRLEFVVDFTAPKPDERRLVWLAHLGEHHRLELRQINQLAATVELTGGHIRNIVLCAAAVAHAAQRTIEWPDIVCGVAVEYRKLNKQIPTALVERG